MHLYEDYDFDLSAKYHDNNFYYNGKADILAILDSFKKALFVSIKITYCFTGEFLLPPSSTLDSSNANKMHLSDLISYPDPSAGKFFYDHAPQILLIYGFQA